MPRADYVEELTLAGAAIGKLAEDKTAFSQAAEAALALDCDRLRGVLAGVSLAERCEVICEWFCSLRCIRVCFILCRRFPIDAAAAPLSEAFEFARASAQLAATPDSFKRVLDALQAEDVDAFGTVIDELQLGRFCVQLCHWLCYLHCFRYCRCVCRPILVPWFTHVGHFDIYADIDSSTGLTNKGLSYSGLYFHGGPGFGFHSCLELRGFCPTTSPNVPGVPMRYRFLYELVAGSPIPITGSLVCDVDAGTRLINWPQNVGGIAGAALVPTFQTIKVAGAPVPDPVPPAPGSPWQGPAEHVITPDAQGWIAVDPNAIGGGFQTLIGFATTQAVAGGDPAPGVPAGSAVPGPNQKNGTDLAIIFEATRLPGPTSPPDFTNSLAKIHLNNWTEVNLLDILQFHTGGGNACSPITTDLDVEFTADHELMAAWALSITSASPSAPGTVASGNAPRGGFGTHHENTTTWQPCSYVVTLSTRAALTDGLIDNQGFSQQKTFCISGGGRPVG